MASLNIYHCNISDIWNYLNTAADKRPTAMFEKNLLSANTLSVFTTDELQRLHSICRLPEPTFPPKKVAKLLIDLSWASSHLEGNSYTYLDTQVLIEYNQRNNDKPDKDAIMILNHKRAIEYLLTLTKIDEQALLAIHQLLLDKLDSSIAGELRCYTEIDIYGSSYIPPFQPGIWMKTSFSELIKQASDLQNPILESFYWLTRLPYLQAFIDGNKLTSRMAANIPLITQGLAPLSFVDFDKRTYLGGLLAFYELQNQTLMKQSFIAAYTASMLRYRHFTPKQRLILGTHFDEYHQLIIQFVNSGDSKILNQLAILGF